MHYMTNMIVTSHRRVDLPSSTGTPVEVDLAKVDFVTVYSVYTLVWCFAGSSAEAISKIAAGDCRLQATYPEALIPCIGHKHEKLYMRSMSSAYVGGLSYSTAIEYR